METLTWILALTLATLRLAILKPARSRVIFPVLFRPWSFWALSLKDTGNGLSKKEGRVKWKH
ncbi:hypothetical protein EZJ49_03570 [Bdellovibrio bacteriovorus]|uniref:hypothetical protein n=1 Tax=Bdellovibrio bacteriovorus TaxID=959 RepID=UPI0021D354C3|nr:hypothetical protein [Bdellovibrio bacteriovorus]UXR65329.1 hypothetical protein EZJ49_03570 [Bdellovibrio bacteriovorus]